MCGNKNLDETTIKLTSFNKYDLKCSAFKDSFAEKKSVIYLDNLRFKFYPYIILLIIMLTDFYTNLIFHSRRE